MQSDIPSRTALRVALRRAAHQLYDGRPLVLDDPFAVPLLGRAYAEELGRTPQQVDRQHSRALRAFLVARSRFAEDTLALAVQSGASQYVLLGAGLDTFALRNPYPALRIFEVDHPATQLWKRGLLQNAGLTLPPGASLVPVDFEQQSLEEQLAGAGFDRAALTVFACLGVVPYLTLPAFRTTLAVITSSSPGNRLVLDYGQPRSALPPREQQAHDSLADRVRLAGEPFQLFFTPAEMAAELHAFSVFEDVGRDELNPRYFKDRSDHLQILGTAGRIASAVLS